MEESPLLLGAGGRSSRMGRTKHLLDFRGAPWMRWQLERFRAAGGRRAIIILPGAPRDEDRAAMAGIDLEMVLLEQADPAAPMSRSLRLAAQRACETGAVAAWWLPVDTPLPGSALLADLRDALQEQASATAAVPAGGGHPVLLGRPVLEMLARDSTVDGARLDVLLNGLDAEGRLARRETTDPLCRLNLNTPEAWRDWQEQADDLLGRRHADA